MPIITKKLLPQVPENLVKQVELSEDLERMECARFTKVAWNIVNNSVLGELGTVPRGGVNTTFPN